MKKTATVLMIMFGLLSVSSSSTASFFTMPYDAVLFMTPMGGSAGAITEFGLGTSINDYTSYFTGLPNTPNPNMEIEAGFFLTGTDLDFYQKTPFGESTYWAFSNSTDQGSLCAFSDIDNSLGFGGSVVEQTGSEEWLLHLDDAASLNIDDDDNDVLIQLRLSPFNPVPIPGAAFLFLPGLGLFVWMRRKTAR